MPLYHYREACLPSEQQYEKQLLQSHTALVGQQELQCADHTDKPYPYNVLLSYHQVATAMQYLKPDSEIQIVRTEEGKIALAEIECYSNNNTLYYIPVYPLYKSLQARPKSKGLQLILSVFAYLYHVVNIPYYRDNGTYLHWQYEMIKDWIKCDPESYPGQTYRQKLAQITKATRIGNKIAAKMHEPCQLGCFEQRVRAFIPQTHWDKEVHGIGKRAVQLYQQYPNATLFDHVGHSEFDYDFISIGDYVSFIHDFEGSLYEDILQTVNEDFGNKSNIQEPTSVYLYGIQGDDRKDIGFEQRLFPLIDDLITLLMEL